MRNCLACLLGTDRARKYVRILMKEPCVLVFELPTYANFWRLFLVVLSYRLCNAMQSDSTIIGLLQCSLLQSLSLLTDEHKRRRQSVSLSRKADGNRNRLWEWPLPSGKSIDILFRRRSC